MHLHSMHIKCAFHVHYLTRVFTYKSQLHVYFYMFEHIVMLLRIHMHSTETLLKLCPHALQMHKCELQIMKMCASLMHIRCAYLHV